MNFELFYSVSGPVGDTVQESFTTYRARTGDKEILITKSGNENKFSGSVAGSFEPTEWQEIVEGKIVVIGSLSIENVLVDDSAEVGLIPKPEAINEAKAIFEHYLSTLEKVG